ncbi:MAG: YeeE/YedE thiosulfate transporter family protein [Vicinamibacterales bacterium]
MNLLLNDLPPIHWAMAGVVITATTLVLLLVANRRLGISSGLEDLCSLVLERPYFRRKAVISGRRWRLPFLGGLLLGGLLSATLGGGWSVSWSLGLLDQRLGLGHAGKLAWMFAGGLFIGFGTRLADGCTSGHGIFGLSNMEMPSLVATVSFMAGGVATTQLLYRVVLR